MTSHSRREQEGDGTNTRQRIVLDNLRYSPHDEEDVRMRHPGTTNHQHSNGHRIAPGTEEWEKIYEQGMSELYDQLPSRQLDTSAENMPWKRRAVSLRPGTLRVSRQIEDELIESIERDLDFEDEDTNQEVIDEAVRTMPTTLSRKRNIKHRLSSKRRKKLTRWKLIKYRFSLAWQNTKYRIRSLTHLFDLWRSHLTTIEGRFGTSVVSYFIFLKWVLLINIPIFLLTFSFLVIPQILYRFYQMEPSGYKSADSFRGVELLTGDGFFEKTEMYYGFYVNETISVFSGTEYKMKYAYLLTSGGYYLFCLIILGYSYLKSYRMYYIEASGTISLYYFNMIFCGWDYGITSKEASDLKKQSMYNEIKEYLAGSREANMLPSRDEITRKWLFRLCTWSVIVALLACSGFLTYTVSTHLSLEAAKENTTDIPLIEPLAMPVVLSGMQLVVPMLFTFLESHEKYTEPKYELYVHMFRDMALKATMLGVLVYFWFEVAASELKCWETFVGEEIYRLVIVDLIFTLGYSFFMEYIRKLCSLKWESVERSEFAIGRHTLELVYSQSLCWLGIFYSPLLPVVVILKMIVIFYVKRLSVVRNCKPSLKPWRASRTHTIFIGYLFIFFILSCVSVGFGIFLIKPSDACGPYTFQDTAYQVMLDLSDSWSDKNDVVKELFDFITSPGFIAGVLIFLCMVVYWSRSVMMSHKKMVEQFRIQLASEGKDKKFLMNLLNQVKIKGRRTSRQPGPTLPKTVEALSPDKNDGSTRGKVFVRAVAEGALTSPAGR